MGAFGQEDGRIVLRPKSTPATRREWEELRLYTVKSYVFAQSLEEAWELLNRDVRNNVILGGCCWLKLGRKRIRTAIDLSRLELDQICLRNGFVEIGAYVPLHRLETDPLLTQRFSGILGRSVEQIVGVPFRNLATVGGSVFSRFGFSDLSTALLALDTRVVLYKAGEMPLEACLSAPLRRGDILVKLRIRDDGRTAAYQSLRRAATDFPVVAAAVSRRGERWTVSVGARPGFARRSPSAEKALAQGLGPAAAGAAASQELPFGSNLRAGADYRRAVASVLVRRAAQACMEGGDQA